MQKNFSISTGYRISNIDQLDSPHRLKVRNAPVKTPVPAGPPPQRLVLRTPNLSRLGVLLALEFRLRAESKIRVELLALVQGLGLCA